MLVEVHILQNFAPSNLNRDDTNSPKDCTFGGFRRARISSQCLKRSIRRSPAFVEAVEGRVGVRTKLVHDRLADLLVEKGRERSEATPRVKRALEAVGFKWDESHTAVLLFVDDGELKAWADVLHEHWDALGGSDEPAATEEEEKEPQKAKKRKSTKEKKAEAAGKVPSDVLKKLKDVMASRERSGVDIALFGRMVAEHTRMNVDAACQVAHAVSTHAVDLEMDFYTAVDDLQPKEDTGAGMMGVVEFNSACFYRYAVIDLDQLVDNLGGTRGVARAAVLGFLKAAVKAIPTGKQNSFAAQNPPDWVRVEVRRSPRSLVNAFAAPIRVNPGKPDLVEQSIAAAQQYASKLDSVFDDSDVRYVGTTTTKPDLCDSAVAFSRLLEQTEAALVALET